MARHRMSNEDFMIASRAKEGRKLIARADVILRKVSRAMSRDARVRSCRYAGALKFKGLCMVYGY